MLKDGLLGVSTLLDRYNRNARLYPAILIALPIVVCAEELLSVHFSWIRSVWAGAATIGGTYLLMQLARDPGKTLERPLFVKWGGMPSVSILRHRDGRIDPITKSRYHNRLSALVTGAVAPTLKSELGNPEAADICYSAWSTHLRTRTRDKKRFPLIFDELVAYGYRRNVLGLRPIGIAVCTLCLLASVVFSFLGLRSRGALTPGLYASLSISILFLVFWVFRVSERWVRFSAECYAARLIEAVDELYEQLPKSVTPAKTRTAKK